MIFRNSAGGDGPLVPTAVPGVNQGAGAVSLIMPASRDKVAFSSVGTAAPGGDCA